MKTIVKKAPQPGIQTPRKAPRHAESPEDFYRKVSTREDVREILKRLAKL